MDIFVAQSLRLFSPASHRGGRQIIRLGSHSLCDCLVLHQVQAETIWVLFGRTVSATV